jgi:hypothetical protein
MTDQDLARRTVEANQIELAVRQHVDTTDDPHERTISVSALRQAVALRVALGNWIVARATRTQRTSAPAAAVTQ